MKKYPNITRDTGEFLSILVQATRASKILKIGTSNGYSTLWLASVLLSCGRIYTVEVNPQKISEARLNFEQAGVSAKITQLAGDVSEVLEHLTERVDFIFLDADRKAYLSLAEPLFNTLVSLVVYLFVIMPFLIAMSWQISPFG
ncbi:O-methyltransferase [Shewanella algidipiscicola]|uniref:O-methyltransferase n=1 Tax=Shewanella algidipiscicola TaxID=614070 RepID=UPI001B87C79F